MSYCRFGWDDSDVYVYWDVCGAIRCCGCPRDGDFATELRSAMIEHLEEHRRLGDNVPEVAFARIRAEIETEGDRALASSENEEALERLRRRPKQ